MLFIDRFWQSQFKEYSNWFVVARGWLRRAQWINIDDQLYVFCCFEDENFDFIGNGMVKEEPKVNQAGDVSNQGSGSSFRFLNLWIVYLNHIEWHQMVHLTLLHHLDSRSAHYDWGWYFQLFNRTNLHCRLFLHSWIAWPRKWNMHQGSRTANMLDHIITGFQVIPT